MILTKDKNFYKNLLLLTLPIALQNLLTFSVGLADNLMVGALGDTAVSGLYMANQIQTLLQVTSAGIEGAILVLATQYWGRRDTERIRQVAAIGVRISLVFGLSLGIACACAPAPILSLFTTEAAVVDAGAQYLRIVSFSFVFFCLTQALIAAQRSVENAKVGFFVSSVSLAVNVTLNYILIYGKFGAPALGIRGAAIATLTARVCECAVAILATALGKKKLGLSVRDLFRFDPALRADFIKYGTPIMLGQIVWVCNMLIGNGLLGRYPEAVITAVSMTNTLANLMYVVMNGMAGAVGIITGRTIGEGKLDRMKEYAKTVQVLFLGLGLLTGGALYLLRLPYIALYGVSAEAAAVAEQMTLVVCVSSIGTCYQCACLFGLVKSGGDTSFVFKNDTVFVFGVVLPSAFLAYYLGAPAWAVFAFLKIDQILKCAVAAIKINRFGWMKKLTR